MWKKPTIAIAALLLPVTVAVTGCGGEHGERTEVGALDPVEAVLVRAERIEARDHVQLRGAVTAQQTATVSTRVMATVTAVRVEVGDLVRRNQLLIEIDPQAARGQLAQAQGALGQARAALAMAERNHERFKALAAQDAASDLELDQARMQHEQAMGAVEQAEGAVATAAAIAADSRVLAPFEGRVARRMVEVGDLAAPGRPLLSIDSAGARRFALSVPEGLMARSGLGVGDSVFVELDSRPELGRLEGKVAEISPGADPVSHSFALELALPVADLPTGGSGRAWVPSGRRSAVAIPPTAVLRRGGTTLVVLEEGGRASSRVVTLGRELADGRVEVLSGLVGGETVATNLVTVPALGTPLEERSP